MTWVKVKTADVQPGDLAQRRGSGLDPRPVADVLPGTRERGHGDLLITLRIGTLITDPIPARWYTFTREVQ